MDYRLVRQSSGWLYLILHPAFHVTYRLLFRKIYLHNRAGVAAQAPVLIASNHPTAFVDPILFCIFFDPPVYNMTRGDIFRKWFFRKVMESVNMFPVYRRRDGYDNRDRNDEVFEYCQKKMLQRVAVNIFVEGQHHLDKRVLPAQKGIARIAFGTYERHKLDDLQIVPVGTNYIHGDRTRDEVKIIVGKPLFVKDYWPDYQKKPAATINKICRDIEIALKTICYHVEERDDDALAEQLLHLWRTEHPASFLPVVEHRAERFWGEKALLDNLNKLPSAQKAMLRERCSNYFSALQSANITDESLLHPEQGKVGWLVLLVLSAPVALIGFLIGWPVRYVSRWVANKVVKKAEFFTSVLMGIATIFGLFYLGLLLLIGWRGKIDWLPPLALLMPVLVWVSMFWHETRLRWANARRASSHPQKTQFLSWRREIWPAQISSLKLFEAVRNCSKLP